MAENLKVERVVKDDGRRAETHVYESVVDGQCERVVETHVEKVPMDLQERLVETIAPIVTARKKELYKDGKVVNTVVEELDRGTVKMTPQLPDNVLTKDDLKSILQEILESNKAPIKLKKKKKLEVTPEPELKQEDVPVKENGIWELVEIGAYVVLSGELAFCLYHLVLKNWI